MIHTSSHHIPLTKKSFVGFARSLQHMVLRYTSDHSTINTRLMGIATIASTDHVTNAAVANSGFAMNRGRTQKKNMDDARI